MFFFAVLDSQKYPLLEFNSGLGAFHFEGLFGQSEGVLQMTLFKLRRRRREIFLDLGSVYRRT